MSDDERYSRIYCRRPPKNGDGTLIYQPNTHVLVPDTSVLEHDIGWLISFLDGRGKVVALDALCAELEAIKEIAERTQNPVRKRMAKHGERLIDELKNRGNIYNPEETGGREFALFKYLSTLAPKAVAYEVTLKYFSASRIKLRQLVSEYTCCGVNLDINFLRGRDREAFRQLKYLMENEEYCDTSAARQIRKDLAEIREEAIHDYFKLRRERLQSLPESYHWSAIGKLLKLQTRRFSHEFWNNLTRILGSVLKPESVNSTKQRIKQKSDVSKDMGFVVVAATRPRFKPKLETVVLSGDRDLGDLLFLRKAVDTRGCAVAGKQFHVRKH